MASEKCVKYAHLKTHCPVCVEIKKYDDTLELLPAKVNSTQGDYRHCTCRQCGTSFTAYGKVEDYFTPIVEAEKPVKAKKKGKRKSRRKAKKTKTV